MRSREELSSVYNIEDIREHIRREMRKEVDHKQFVQERTEKIIKAIPTVYNGIRFRSRLEARWATVFDMLGWPWDYEPFELAGYIPDFILPFEDGVDVLVEIKPITRLNWPLWKSAANKIDTSGWIGGLSKLALELRLKDKSLGAAIDDLPSISAARTKWTENKIELDPPKPALILGSCPRQPDYCSASPIDDPDLIGAWSGFGFMRDDSEGLPVWYDASIAKCLGCQASFPYVIDGDGNCRRCGDKREHSQGPDILFNQIWNDARNKHQWVPGAMRS